MSAFFSSRRLHSAKEMEEGQDKVHWRSCERRERRPTYVQSVKPGNLVHDLATRLEANPPSQVGNSAVYAIIMLNLLDRSGVAVFFPHASAVELSRDLICDIYSLLIDPLTPCKALRVSYTLCAVVPAAVLLEGQRIALLLVVAAK